MSKATISSPNFQGKKWIYQNSPKALHDDEYEELKELKLRVFIKFQELVFDWASRLVHYMLGFQLDIKKKFSLLEFENLTGQNSEYIEDLERPHCVEIITSFERCEGWSRDDRKRLAYLYSTPTRVLMDSVKGRDILGCYTINGFAQALQGRKGRRQFKEAILSQTRVINFVQKDIGVMLPKWEFDVEDTPTENIIKLIPAKKKVVKEDSPRPRKKARKEASEEAAAEASEEEIEYLPERVEAVEKKVGITTKRKRTSVQNITPPPKPTLEPGVKHVCFVYSSESVNGTNAGRKSLPEDKGPDVPADASSSKDKAPEPSFEDARYLEKRDDTLALCRAKMIIPNKKLYPGYNPFAPIDKKKLKELADWLKTFIIEHLSIKNHVQVELGDDLPISLLKTYQGTTLTHNISGARECASLIIFLLSNGDSTNFKDSKPDQNGLGRGLTVNYNDTHWIAM
ncbi:BnaC03g60910D [Brassica napus]|uniref:BnaC03g60910D protein n=1 Tax=Brassica napus TaxID=3708 RepID=A0A078HPH8_BRANA|nr:BnaC03g60910D [Brassica napus]